MKLMVPFTPHLASECLEKLGSKNVDKWPEIQSTNDEEIQFAIQVNGKTRDIINIQKNLSENEIDKKVKRESKARKFIIDKKIIKTIYVKGKIINYIVKP